MQDDIINFTEIEIKFVFYLVTFYRVRKNVFNIINQSFR